MDIIHNEILVKAPPEKIWKVLSTPELLDRYDPTVRKSVLISNGTTDLAGMTRGGHLGIANVPGSGTANMIKT